MDRQKILKASFDAKQQNFKMAKKSIAIFVTTARVVQSHFSSKMTFWCLLYCKSHVPLWIMFVCRAANLNQLSTNEACAVHMRTYALTNLIYSCSTEYPRNPLYIGVVGNIKTNHDCVYSWYLWNYTVGLGVAYCLDTSFI